VHKLLQKDYQQRYQSAGEVLQALVKVPPHPAQPVAPTVLSPQQLVAPIPKKTPNVPLINRLIETIL